MPAYNFKSQFVEPIQAGTKHTTIRPCRKRPTREGDTLHLFTGMRTKACRKIGAYQCVKIEPIIIEPVKCLVQRGGRTLAIHETKRLVVADGFENFRDFFEFFRDVYGENTLTMEMITWGPLQ